MISIDDHPPSDPSSSYHQEQQHISHDLKVSYLDLKFSDADLNDINNQLPNFSIRDYVFGIRNKDIACSWPFSSSSLQLCLKHGVKNLLPPFQSIDSLRNNSSLSRCSLDKNFVDEEVIKSFDGKSKNDRFKSKQKIALLRSVTTKSSASKEDQESQFNLQLQTKLKEKDKPQNPENSSSIRAIIKKSRFVTKLNSGVEHFAPNFEIMTSKVCPVCKVFSSSSNTTLNAHIDQCLTGEGTMKWTENPKIVVKQKVKPRKMRLMMEIYKTAPHCTIEELDRRNGTSWAANSSFPAQEFQFQNEEEEKEEPMKTTTNIAAASNEGDVYIDTDGIKVRILSVPKPGSSDNHGGKKKTNIVKKKHHHKYLKLKPNARKLRLQKLQARSSREDVVADLGIIRPPWACSKRTGLSKKFSFKKFGVHFDEKSDDGQSQDSFKKHSRKEQIAEKSQTSNGESVNGDELHDVESVRNKTLLPDIVPATSFMGLSASFDPEFSKQECRELYQDQIYSINSHEVDPIPIPGPPGSFLPTSPGGEMVSEEEIQIYRDSMINSPVSTVSSSISTSVRYEKGSSHNSFKKDHQPCCCSKKEVSLSYQDSYILKKQQLKFKSELFPSAPETATFPTHKKFPVSIDCDFPVGSPSKPVLRLMGKNLTVVKTDEDEFRPPQSGQQPIHGGFMASVDRYGQKRVHHGHTVLDFQTISSKPINEIIIIDDSPEKEAADSMGNDFFKRNQRQMNPCGGGFQTFLGNNGDPGSKWNIRPPLMSHLRSSTSYDPPNYL